MRVIGFLALLSLLAACRDGTDPVLESPGPTFAPERMSPGSGQIVLTGYGVGDRVVRLFVYQDVARVPAGIDLYLRLDPGANASIPGLTTGEYCSGQIDVLPTSNPGEWNIRGRPSTSACTSCPPWRGLAIATMDVVVDHAGSWPISLGHGRSGYDGDADIYGCETGWRRASGLFGGTLTVSTP